MDPYAVVTLGSQKLQTDEHEDGGKTPVWNNLLSFKRANEDKLIIEVWESDGASKDDIIGTGTLNLTSSIVNKKGLQTETVKLLYKEKEVGTVVIELEFNPKEVATTAKLQQKEKKPPRAIKK
jgi:Ca2+-dependent lipid-binding protein